MFDKYMALTRGFKNVSENGQIVGFQLMVRITYYRGIFLCIVSGFDVTVDGEKFNRDQMRFTVAGHQYTFEEMGKTENVHWDFGVPAILTVLKPGGLKPGIHDLEIVEQVKPSYMGPNGFLGRSKRKITLVI